MLRRWCADSSTRTEGPPDVARLGTPRSGTVVRPRPALARVAYVPRNVLGGASGSRQVHRVPTGLRYARLHASIVENAISTCRKSSFFRYVQRFRSGTWTRAGGEHPLKKRG